MSPKARVLIALRDGRSHVVQPGEGHRKVPGLGVVDSDAIARAEPGGLVELCGEWYIVAGEPSLQDLLSTAERRAQIITLKDIGPIVARLGIGPGARVIEVGGGSGYLTIALAHFVGSVGRVLTYDVDPRAAELVERNLRKAGLAERVEVRVGDATVEEGSGGWDSMVADIPNPWDLLGFAEGSLRPGGLAAFYTPAVNQVEAVVRALRSRGWLSIVTIETLERQMVVGEHGTRPSFDMLGHTGYLTFARWPGRAAAAETRGIPVQM